MAPQSILRRADILWARFSDETPTFAKNRKRVRGRRAQGVRYEKKAHTRFSEQYGDRYIQSPWISYLASGDGSVRWAQPDALLIDLDAGLITICEMKYQHCTEAYWQLLGKYLPLLQHIFPRDLWRFATVEVVKWYDCSVQFPAAVTLRDAVHRVKPGEFGVHIWKP